MEQHPALGPQFTTSQTRKPVKPADYYKAEMDYRYSDDLDRPTDERFEKDRGR